MGYIHKILTGILIISFAALDPMAHFVVGGAYIIFGLIDLITGKHKPTAGTTIRSNS